MAHDLQTVRSSLVLCGVSDVVDWNDQTHAQRIASDLFDDDFQSFMDKTFSALDEDWKTYSSVTQTNGQIRLLPGVKKNIRALVQWVRDRIRLGENPADTPFPVAEASAILRRYHTHKNWLDKAKEKATTTMPKVFKADMKWLDFRDSLRNFLRTQPGRNGVPLSSVIRESENPLIRNNVEFIDDYIDRATLEGEAFASDAAEVHGYIVNLIAGNATAENKILPYLSENNGRKDYIALKKHYEGVGAHAKALVEAENDIQSLFYAGEKKPHMWWEEFETRLVTSFAVIDKHEGREVYSDTSKLRMLAKKVRTCDFLESTLSVIDLELTKEPVTLTFDQALANFRNAVNRKFPPETSAIKKTRRINQLKNKNKNSNHNSFYKNKNKKDGRQGIQGTEQQNKGNTRKRNDTWEVIGTDGSKIEVHPSYSFSGDVWNKIPFPVRAQLMDMRKEYKKTRSQKQVRTKEEEGNEGTSNGDGTIMGGRNEQASLRTRNPNSRS